MGRECETEAHAERERDRETERQRETERDRERDRKRVINTRNGQIRARVKECLGRCTSTASTAHQCCWSWRRTAWRRGRSRLRSQRQWWRRELFRVARQWQWQRRSPNLVTSRHWGHKIGPQEFGQEAIQTHPACSVYGATWGAKCKTVRRPKKALCWGNLVGGTWVHDPPFFLFFFTGVDGD